jgi:VWFA-related protein
MNHGLQRKTSPQLGLVGICVLFLSTSLSAQTKPQSPAEPQDDVIRVNTELVQTDVMVFDKDGHFVDGLKGDQFALKIDNRPTPISFFERVAAGRKTLDRNSSSSDSTSAVASSSSTPNPPVNIVRGRAVIFFVDDLHLAADSLLRTRQALLDFIDHGMADNDQVAITSSSGQIGFLQQFTDDRFALRSAVARLNFRGQPSKTDMFRPPMSEYIAMKIRDGDRSVMEYYMSEMMKQECYRSAPGGPYSCYMSPQSMRQLIIERANMITLQAGPDTRNTLALLQGLMRSAAQLPGRKLVFVISDGFYLNDREMNSHDKIQKITEAAGRAGVVIYTLDARGIIGENFDVTNDRPMDGAGFTTGLSSEHIAASQDGMNALAADTGGRAFRNTNAPMSEWIDKVLDETANYYLIAWRPDGDEQKRGKFNHIEASIVGRPDLTVRLRSAYFKSAPLPTLSTKKKNEKDSAKAREDDMRLVIDAPVSQNQIPTALDLHLSQMPGVGTQVTATIQISREALTFDFSNEKKSADVDIGGIIYDDKGKPLNSFVGRLRIFPVPEDAPASRRSQAVYAFHAWLPAGLFQVRVGIRDIKSGRIGSAMQWIDVPKVLTR